MSADATDAVKNNNKCELRGQKVFYVRRTKKILDGIKRRFYQM
jgi:hypothetical protein